MKAIIFLLTAVFFIGCATTLPLRNTIPYGTQQLIKSVQKNSQINYKYIPSKLGEIKTQGISYSLNFALSGMFKELIESKFNNITETAEDNINIEITKSNGYDDMGLFTVSHNLDLSIKVSLLRNKKASEREFTYSTGFTRTTPEKASEIIEEFLLKFVVAIDKFIDTEFEIQ